jgi:hypothetical protein
MQVVLEYIFDWLPFGIGVPILIGTGFLLIAEDFREFKAARVCFYLATFWIYGKVIMWSYFTSDRFLVRAVVAILVFGFVGLGLQETLRLTRRRETVPQPPSPSPPSAHTLLVRFLQNRLPIRGAPKDTAYVLQLNPNIDRWLFEITNEKGTSEVAATIKRDRGSHPGSERFPVRFITHTIGQSQRNRS